jgi:hypothetical protein
MHTSWIIEHDKAKINANLMKKDHEMDWINTSRTSGESKRDKDTRETLNKSEVFGD